MTKADTQIASLRSKYGEELEVRAVEVRAQDADSLTIEGYAALYDEVTNLGYFNEQIARGAFDDVLTDDVRLLINHEGVPLARTINGSLELSTDERGLFYRAHLIDTQEGRDLYKMIQRGDISQSSFAFTIEEDSWDDKRTLRTIKRVKRMYDVAPVTYPAYSATSVSARSFAIMSPDEAPPKAEEKKQGAERQKKKNEVVNFTGEQQRNAMNFKTSTEAARYISQLDTKLRSLSELAEAEERALTTEELEETEQIHEKIAKAEQLRDSLAKNEARLKRLAADASAVSSTDKELDKIERSFNFGKALKEAAYGQLTGVEAEMSQEARHEASALGLGLRGNFTLPSALLKRNVYGNDSAQTGVATDVTTTGTQVQELVGALRSNSLLQRLGATELTGFTGNVKMPTLPTDAAETPAEGAAVTGNTGAMGGQILSPQRIAQQMIVTKEALNQATGNMGAVIAADFGRSIAVAQDTHAFTAITGDGSSATLATATGTIVGGTETGTNDLVATDAEDIRNLWAAVTAAGAEINTKFVAHPTIYAYLMGLANVASIDPLVRDGRIFGYDFLTSGSLPTIDLSAVQADAVITGGAAVALGANFAAMKFVYYGDFADLFTCTWGGLDVTIDPYSGSSAGTIKIVVDNYFDAKVRRAGSVGALVASSANLAGADS